MKGAVAVAVADVLYSSLAGQTSRLQWQPHDLTPALLCVLVQRSLLVGLLLPPFVGHRGLEPRTSRPQTPGGPATHTCEPRLGQVPRKSDPLPLESTRPWLCAVTDRHSNLGPTDRSVEALG
eukprot:scaffold106696_cov48-Phaeocystis_antarctica.AAC.2